MVPPVVMIFVEACDDARVITTCAREIGIATEPKPNSGCPQAKNRLPSTLVTVHPALSERSPRTRSIPTMSPGLICESVGEAAHCRPPSPIFRKPPVGCRIAPAFADKARRRSEGVSIGIRNCPSPAEVVERSLREGAARRRVLVSATPPTSSASQGRSRISPHRTCSGWA